MVFLYESNFSIPKQNILQIHYILQSIFFLFPYQGLLYQIPLYHLNHIFYIFDIFLQLLARDSTLQYYLKIKELINVKYIWLECQNEPKLISFYQNFGFKMLESLTSEEGLKVMIMELK